MDSDTSNFCPGNSSSMQAVKDIAFGSIAGMAAEVLEYPFDLAKVRLQSQVLDNASRFRGPLDCLVQTWRGEGIRGLYRGLPVPIFGAMADTAALFVAYSQLQNLMYWSTSPRQLTLSELGIAAAGAGFLTSFILTPIELVKCKMQVQMLAVPLGIPDFKTIPPFFIPATTTISDIIAPQKPTPILRKLPGPLAIIAGIVRNSGTAVWFTSKEFFASRLLARRARYRSSPSSVTPKNQTTELSPWESVLSGALAGGVCVLALYPADTVKSAIQTADELRPPDKFTRSSHLTNKPGGFWKTARTMYKAKGWGGLYAGCGMTLAKAIPCSGVVFAIYDGLAQRYG